MSTSTTRPAGTARWLAPELLIGSGGTCKASDVYAYACVCYEIFTGGCHPFPELPNEMAVAFHVTQGKRPARPANAPELKDEMWALMKLCWDAVAAARPTADQLLDKVLNIDTGGSVFSPAPGWDESVFAQVWANVEYRPLVNRSIPVTSRQGREMLASSGYVALDAPRITMKRKAKNFESEHPECTTNGANRSSPKVQEGQVRGLESRLTMSSERSLPRPAIADKHPARTKDSPSGKKKFSADSRYAYPGLPTPAGF
ncbi:Rho guanine nucleotide exchange factor [Marasmius crinis-equi]|uniref:Rho guanine nucleotide exchange factor n=1 Tax=Marasmius crinis-equi TaxID=585013 RepID=A0ABR3F6X9_9AGAR